MIFKRKHNMFYVRGGMVGTIKRATISDPRVLSLTTSAGMQYPEELFYDQLQEMSDKAGKWDTRGIVTTLEETECRCKTGRAEALTILDGGIRILKAQLRKAELTEQHSSEVQCDERLIECRQKADKRRF